MFIRASYYINSGEFYFILNRKRFKIMSTCCFNIILSFLNELWLAWCFHQLQQSIILFWKVYLALGWIFDILANWIHGKWHDVKRVDSLHHLESFPVFSFDLEMLQAFPLMSCVVVITQRGSQSFIFESQKFNCFFRLAMRDNRL